MKNYARCFGQDLMRGEGNPTAKKPGGGMSTSKVNGVLMTSDSGNDPAYYYKKQQVEAQLGRTLTREEFQRDYYQGPDTYASGTSIFDPVLCELAYRWFCPPGGLVLDPFAGGSVRGIVAGALGRRYVGVELRAEQVAANRKQGAVIFRQPQGAHTSTGVITDPAVLTPVERRGPYLLKREDLFCVNGANGGKARATLLLAQGAPGLISISARTSPQNTRAALIAQHLGIPARCHTGTGSPTPYTQRIKEAGAELLEHAPARLTVLKARAKADAEATPEWAYIPFGAVHPKTVAMVQAQTANIPADVPRIVLTVGSGTTLAGILHGLDARQMNTPVLGVCVGGDPSDTLDQLAPAGWRDRVTLVHSALPFEEPAQDAVLEGLRLDPIYEAKALPFLQPDDLFWLVGGPIAPAQPQGELVAPEWRVGDSRNMPQVCPDVAADFVFSCPPYADLEVYSDDPADLSTMPYGEFREAYCEIIAKTCAQLKPDRFACFVVGDVRDSKGHYYNFVGDTVEAFRAAGLHYYNEAVLVTAVGSLPIRVGRQFAAGRKLGKTHQNVLVFVKGDWRKAVQACGECEMGDVPELTHVEG